MAVGFVMYDSRLIVAVVPPTVGLWFVLRRFGRLSQEMQDLDALHGFAGRVGDTLDVDEIASRSVADVVDLIHADGAALLRIDGERVDVTTSGHMPIRLPRHTRRRRVVAATSWRLDDAGGRRRQRPALARRRHGRLAQDPDGRAGPQPPAPCSRCCWRRNATSSACGSPNRNWPASGTWPISWR